MHVKKPTSLLAKSREKSQWLKWSDITNRQPYSGGEAYESVITLCFCHPRRSGGHFIKHLSVFFTDKFALSQSDARISVAYKICQWKSLTKCLMKCPPGDCHIINDNNTTCTMLSTMIKLIQWNLVITRTFGPWNYLVISGLLLYSGTSL